MPPTLFNEPSYIWIESPFHWKFLLIFHATHVFPHHPTIFSVLYSHILMSVYLSDNYHQLPENLSFTDIYVFLRYFRVLIWQNMSVHCKVVEITDPKKEVKKEKQKQKPRLISTCCFPYHHHSVCLDINILLGRSLYFKEWNPP